MDEHVTDPCTAKRLPRELPTDPMRWARAWLDEAVAKQVQRNPNTMTAITVNDPALPSESINRVNRMMRRGSCLIKNYA